MTTAKTAKKQKRSGFKPGQSGNPKGRPQGSRNNVTLAMEALLEGEAEALTRKAIEKALGGDMTALRICFDRLYPPRKTRGVLLKLPVIKHIKDIDRGYEVVLQAVSEGSISPDEASTLSSVLEAKRKAIETTEIEGRIAALEKEHLK